LVLILSISTDLSTVHVLEWLNAWNVPWIRLNPEDLIDLLNLQIDSTGRIEFVLAMEDGRKISSKQITAYWYRRGDFTLNHKQPNPSDQQTPLELQSHFSREADTLLSALHTTLRSVRHLNGRTDNETNKVSNLAIAARHGLKVPRTLITTSKSELQRFWNECNGIVAKGIHSSFFFHEDDIDYEGFTRRVTSIEMDELSCKFQPSLFQEEIAKKYEIRSFYLAGSFYSMAIFSQTNVKTEVDFRNYDQIRPNRTVPYRLPDTTERQLSALMGELDMHCGSIDLIRMVDGTHVFLEVNPIGQFGQVSIPCNYALEMLVARYLCNDER
jgi:ATP-GRASP peptide maturase of grasp-with-spasm system